MRRGTENGDRSEKQLQRLLWLLSAVTFLIFFQAYMVAPLIPRLSNVFSVSSQMIGLIVPAYMIPYGVSTLFYGLFSDRVGRWRIMRFSLVAFLLLTALTATAQTASQMILWRVLTGLGASGVAPLALALMGDLFPYERRGRPLGWLFGAMAGGMAFGSTVGVVLEPFVGWRMLFLGVAVASVCLLVLLLPYGSLFPTRSSGPALSTRQVLSGYRSLLATGRGFRTYGYVFLNSIFHSGIYTWLGLYFARRYSLGEIGIGLALLGYGVPGFLFGPVIGRVVDRYGRRWILPMGVGIAATAAITLILKMPLVGAALAVTALSLGYDMTQPLLAGIVTHLGGKERGGQAMGLNVFTLFTGFGVGSLLFGEALRLGFGAALGIFSGVQLVAALTAIPFFRFESVKQAPSAAVR